MLMANVLAKLDAVRDDLERHHRDLKSVEKIIAALQEQRSHIIKEISDLEYKIEELEDELDA